MDNARTPGAKARARFDNYASTVNLLTGARLSLLTGPDDLRTTDYPGTPPQFVRAYRALANDPYVRDLPADVVFCTKPVPGVVFALANASCGSSLIVLGPYRHHKATGEEARQALEAVDAKANEANIAYLSELPIIMNTQAVAILVGIVNIMNDTDALLYELHGMDEVRPEATGQQETHGAATDFAQAKAVEQRYRMENEMLDAVIRSDEKAAAIALRDFQNTGALGMHRNPDTLRDHKNGLIILNTLLRKTLERAHIHPSYIDAISTRWGFAIERTTSLDKTLSMPFAMVQDYCAQVKSYTLEGYSPNVRAAIAHIMRHISDSDLSLSSISSALGLNATYLSHQFNQEVGMSVPNYVTRVRIDRAQNLLRQNSKMSISAVALEVGYLDLSYFSKRFRSIVGCSPSEYRKQQNQN